MNILKEEIERVGDFAFRVIQGALGVRGTNIAPLIQGDIRNART